MQSRIFLAICLALFPMLLANTPLVHAEDRTDGTEVADPTGGNPCTAKVSYQGYVDYLIEQRDRLRRARNAALEEYDEACRALVEAMYEALELKLYGEDEYYRDHLEELLACYRRSSISDWPRERIEPNLEQIPPGLFDRLAENRPTHEDWEFAFSLYVAAMYCERVKEQELYDAGQSHVPRSGIDWDHFYYSLAGAKARYNESKPAFEDKNQEYNDANEQVIRAQATLASLTEACNTTRVRISVWDRLITDMEVPAGSFRVPVSVPERPQPPHSGEGQMAIPETDTTTEQAAPQLASPTMQAHPMFPRLPEAGNRTGSSAATPGQAQTQSSPTLTGQTMQVQQPAATTNPGTEAVGHTHMQLPQNTGQSEAAVTSRKPLKALPPVRTMSVPPAGPAMRR